MDDLEETAARLMAAVRNLPPGPERQDALKEVGRLRSRMYGLLQQAPPLLVSSRPTSCPNRSVAGPRLPWSRRRYM
jgi:hypothetical protein